MTIGVNDHHERREPRSFQFLSDQTAVNPRYGRLTLREATKRLMRGRKKQPRRERESSQE